MDRTVTSQKADAYKYFGEFPFYAFHFGSLGAFTDKLT